MSLLDRQITYDEPSKAKVAAKRLLMMTKQTFTQMVNSFNEGSKMFWENRSGATPEEIAAELGTDAAEMFDLHARLGALISQVKPGAISEGLSVVGNFTVNEDKTITVNSTPN